MKGKRGQFYLVAAIIIVLILYGLSQRVNVFEEQPSFTDFNKLANNYVSEATRISNYGIFKGLDVPSFLSSFTLNFMEYARTRDPNLGIVYIYNEGDNGRTYIENHLTASNVVTYDTDDPANVGGILFNSESETINEISLVIGGEEYKHGVPTKLKHFSTDYYSTSVPTNGLKIDIAGVPYFYDPIAGSQFDVIVKTGVEQEAGNLPGIDKTCSYSGIGGWDTC